ncbi:flagellar biosynthesis protein FlhF [Candidatus Latescibacterota bacterium]
MIIKKFTAPTMTEALAKVREELGTDAIILSTRSEKKGGVLDLIGRPKVEVTAAIDDKQVESGQHEAATTATRSAPVGPREASLYPPSSSGVYDASTVSSIPKRVDETRITDLGGPVKMDQILEDIKGLKKSISDLADSALTNEMDGLPDHLDKLLKRLNASGVEEKISKRLVRQLLNDLNGAELSDPGFIKEKATALLASGVGKPTPVLFKGAKPRIVAFVGPTGSGKTTTIAKLATEFTLSSSKNVSVLTIDTKRVDAVGQLKAYCRIINIPLFIAYSPEDIPGIMPGIMESDITLVDTPGSGPMDKAQMLEMVEFLQKLVPQEVHLALSITTSFAEMNRIHNNFGMLKPNRLLFTKLDETDMYGPMLSFALAAKKHLSYATFGQNVPGDFNVVDIESIITHILDMNQDDTRKGKK